MVVDVVRDVVGDIAGDVVVRVVEDGRSPGWIRVTPTGGQRMQRK